MPESELALTAILALDHFGDADKDALELLEKQLSVPGHAYQASLALLQNGRKESLAILEGHLRCEGNSAWVHGEQPSRREFGEPARDA